MRPLTHHISKLMLCLAMAIFSPGIIHAQLNLLNNTINGQPIVSSSINLGNTGSGIGAIASTKNAYIIDKNGKVHGFMGVNGKTIVDIAAKSNSDTFKVLILFSDGSATLANPYMGKNGGFSYGYRDFKKADSSYISKSFKKIAGDDIYVLSTAGFYVTHDLGKSWNWDTTGLKGTYINDFTLDSAQNVYLATGAGLFVQSPTATSWTKMTFKTTGSISKIFFDRKNRMLVNNGSSKGTFISNDLGKNWSYDTTGLGYLYVSNFSDDVYNNLYAVISDGSIYKSDGGTSSWKPINGDLLAKGGKNIMVNSLCGDSILLAGTSFGLYKSNDQGKSWSEANDSIKTESATSFVKTPSGRIFITTKLGLYHLDPSDKKWTKDYPSVGYNSTLSIMGDQWGRLYLFDQTINSKYSATPMLVSTDNGANWKLDTAGLGKITGNVFFMDETGAQHWASSYYSGSSYTNIWSRTPGGKWTLDNSKLPSKNYSFFTSMGSDKQGYIYAAGNISGANMMYRHPVSGGSWELDTAGLAGVSFYNMTSGGNAGIFAWNGTKIFHKSGNTWKAISLPVSLSYPGVNAVSVDSNGVLFAAFNSLFSNDVGIYYSKDTGANWIFAGLEKTDVKTLRSFGDTTYALTGSSWVYSLTASPFITSVESNTADENTTSFYPNPFHSATTISYTLTKEANIRLEIYSLLGEKVANLEYGNKETGLHSCTVNGEQLKEGIYIYRLYSGSSVITGKIIRN